MFNFIFHKNPSIGNRVDPSDGRTDRQTDTVRLIVTLRSFAKTLKTTSLREA